MSGLPMPWSISVSSLHAIESAARKNRRVRLGGLFFLAAAVELQQPTTAHCARWLNGDETTLAEPDRTGRGYNRTTLAGMA